MPCLLSRSYSARIRPGEDGGGGGSGVYEHVQASAAATWTINHNLGRRVDVTLLTVGGAEFWAEILHTSLNQTLVYLATPLAGRALVN